MEHLTFHIDRKTLNWPGKGSWTAVSGPWGNGSLETGRYTIERTKAVEGGLGGSFQDEGGDSFFIPLTPQFSTMRTGLGIHPDGNVPGTLGCVGIQSNASEFLKLFKNTSTSMDMELTVEK